MCLEQNISIGSIHASFHNFHNVSMYVKWPQKLVWSDSPCFVGNICFIDDFMDDFRLFPDFCGRIVHVLTAQ